MHHLSGGMLLYAKFSANSSLGITVMELISSICLNIRFKLWYSSIVFADKSETKWNEKYPRIINILVLLMIIIVHIACFNLWACVTIYHGSWTPQSSFGWHIRLQQERFFCQSLDLSTKESIWVNRNDSEPTSWRFLHTFFLYIKICIMLNARLDKKNNFCINLVILAYSSWKVNATLAIHLKLFTLYSMALRSR